MQQGQSPWVPGLLFNAILRPSELPDSPYGMHLVTPSCGLGSLPKASGDPAWVVHRPISPVSYSADLCQGGSFKGGQIWWRCESLVPPQRVSGNTANNVIHHLLLQSLSSWFGPSPTPVADPGSVFIALALQGYPRLAHCPKLLGGF